MIRVGIIGAGAFAHKHANAIKQNPDAVLVAASRRNLDELNKFTQEYGIKGYSDYKELLNDKTINAVLIATPHHLHHQITESVAKAGKHILLEKPMAHNVDACEQILKSVEKYNSRLMIAHIIRFMPAFIKAKKMLDEGIIGDLVYAQSHIARKWNMPNRRSWHLDKNKGGGMLTTVGIHYIDLLTWIIGDKVKAVKASISNPFLGKETDDAALLFLTLQKWKKCIVNQLRLNNGGQLFEVVITGTKGMIKADIYKGVWLGQNDEWIQIQEPERNDPEDIALANEWQDFIDKIKLNQPPSITGKYGLHIMEIIEAAQKSSRLGEEIVLND